MPGKLKLLAGLATGYVLGARAGRERYERIVEATRRLAERPEVRELTGKVRSGLGAGLEKAAGTEPPETDESGRDGAGWSPEPGPSDKGPRGQSRSGS